ncbi:MAG: hypothetical protein HYU38_03555 [Candidatus Tectomicrobia bacterium]|nr:hypothetical protein [Candidatus Tectomicrobia bacterium]
MKYLLEPRQHDLYGMGGDLYLAEGDGSRPKEPIAFIPGKDENAAALLAQQWLKVAFPAEAPKGKKK